MMIFFLSYDYLYIKLFPLFLLLFFFFFFLNDPAPTEISPLPLHDALPISLLGPLALVALVVAALMLPRPVPRLVSDGPGSVIDYHAHTNASHDGRPGWMLADRKSTRLNSSHSQISYAVFCLKKKKHT